MTRAEEIQNFKLTISGVSWFILSCLGLSILISLVRYMSDEFSVFQIGAMQNICSLVFFVPILVKSKFQVVKTKKIGLHLTRGIAGFIGISLWFYCATLMPISEVIALGFAFPLSLTVMAAIFLKEKVSAYGWIALIAGFTGVIVVMQPVFTEFNRAHLLLILTTFIWSFANVIIKKLTKTDSPNTIVFYMSLIIAILSIIATFIPLPNNISGYRPMATKDILLFFAIGSSYYFAYFAMTMAYSKTDVSILQPLDFSKLIFTTIIAYFLFDQGINLWVVLGSIIILISSHLSVTIRKYEHTLILAKQNAEEEYEKARMARKAEKRARKDAEEALDIAEKSRVIAEKSHERAVELANERRSFANIVSHDIRNPIIIMKNMVSYLRNNLDDKEVLDKHLAEYLEYIHVASDDALKLADNILDKSKVESGKMTIDEEEFDLLRVINDTIILTRVDCKHQHRKLVEELDDKSIKSYLNNSGELIIKADERKIKQSVSNILSNAVKFAGLNGTVTIGIKVTGTAKNSKNNYLEIYVSDSGKGISKENIAIIMEEFEQSKEGGKIGHSTGLGLPIAKKFVEMHHGKLVIESEEDEGTTVRILLPKKVIIKKK